MYFACRVRKESRRLSSHRVCPSCLVLYLVTLRLWKTGAIERTGDISLDILSAVVISTLLTRTGGVYNWSKYPSEQHCPKGRLTTVILRVFVNDGLYPFILLVVASTISLAR